MVVAAAAVAVKSIMLPHFCSIIIPQLASRSTSWF